LFEPWDFDRKKMDGNDENRKSDILEEELTDTSASAEGDISTG
jgi:hypothetical protein